MTTAHDVPADDLIERTAEELKSREAVEPPEWARFAKTGQNRELPPEEDDWWYTRSAAVFRRVYTDGPIGVSRLKKLYGGKDRGGTTPSHQSDGSGSVIRTVVQQLEEEGLLEHDDDGRTVTPDGQSLLDSLAGEVAEEIPELDRY